MIHFFRNRYQVRRSLRLISRQATAMRSHAATPEVTVSEDAPPRVRLSVPAKW